MSCVDWATVFRDLEAFTMVMVAVYVVIKAIK